MLQFVGIVLVKPDGSVLAQHRSDVPEISGPNTWCVPGGAREVGDENLIEVGQRELFEETGYYVPTKKFRHLARDIYFNETRQEWQQRTILWARYDGVQEIHCYEGQAMEFIHPSRFDELEFYTGHEAFLKRASEKVFYGGKERIAF